MFYLLKYVFFLVFLNDVYIGKNYYAHYEKRDFCKNGGGFMLSQKEIDFLKH